MEYDVVKILRDLSDRKEKMWWRIRRKNDRHRRFSWFRTQKVALLWAEEHKKHPTFSLPT